MANLNRVMLMGRLTRDPETRYTKTGTAVCDLSLAINRVLPAAEQEGGGERREEVTYVDITLWGKTAEVAQQYLTKGRGVFIEGRLQLDTWDDQQTGQKRSRLKVVGEHLEFLPGSKPAQGQSEAAAESKPANNKRQAPAARPQPARDPDLDAEPDDIPFHSTIYRDVRRSKLNRRVF
jgi:single-strand DNA-binding protein